MQFCCFVLHLKQAIKNVYEKTFYTSETNSKFTYREDQIWRLI